MTFEEKLDMAVKSIELENAGQREEASALMKQIPLSPYLAEAARNTFGADFLINGGYNLSEAEAEYGTNWLYR